MSSSDSVDELILEPAAEAVVYAIRQGVVERWNAAATRMLGPSAAEALGQSLDLVIPEHLRKAHRRGFDAAMASGRTRLGGRPTLTRGLHKSVQKLYVEMSFALVVDDAGAPLGSVAVARDATKRMGREKAAASDRADLPRSGHFVVPAVACATRATRGEMFGRGWPALVGVPHGRNSASAPQAGAAGVVDERAGSDVALAMFLHAPVGTVAGASELADNAFGAGQLGFEPLCDLFLAAVVALGPLHILIQ